MNDEDYDIGALLVDYMEKNCFANLEQISKQFRLGPHTIQRHLRNAGVLSFKKFRKFLICCELLERIRSNSGATAPELAKHFNVNRQLISYYLKVMGMKILKRRDRRNASMIDKPALAAHIESNPDATQREIGKHFGVSDGYIIKLIRKFNIPYRPKDVVAMTGESLAAFIAEYPNLTQQQIALHFQVSKCTIQRHIKRSKIPYRLKRSKADPINFIRYVNEHPEATSSKLASHFGIGLTLVGRLRRLFPENNFDIALARYIRQHPNTNRDELKKHFRVNENVIKQHLPGGVPRQWTKEIVEKILDEWVLLFGDELTPGMLTKRAKYLHHAFYKLKLYKEYPLHYWKFHSHIYPLFGMDAFKDYDEELQMEWPPQETLHKRYRELLKIYHPDRHHHNPQISKAAHFKFHWIVKAYGHLLKRHKKLTIGEPPPAVRQTTNSGRKITAL